MLRAEAPTCLITHYVNLRRATYLPCRATCSLTPALRQMGPTYLSLHRLCWKVYWPTGLPSTPVVLYSCAIPTARSIAQSLEFMRKHMRSRLIFWRASSGDSSSPMGYDLHRVWATFTYTVQSHPPAIRHNLYLASGGLDLTRMGFDHHTAMPGSRALSKAAPSF